MKKTLPGEVSLIIKAIIGKSQLKTKINRSKLKMVSNPLLINLQWNSFNLSVLTEITGNLPKVEISNLSERNLK
jgi:hypothetical protein